MVMICFFFTPKSGVMVPYKLVKTGAHSRGHAAGRPRNILESQTCAAQPWYYLTPTTSFHSGGGGTWNPKISEMTSTKSSVESNIFVKVVYKHNIFFCSLFKSFWGFPKRWRPYLNGVRDLQFDIHEPTEPIVRDSVPRLQGLLILPGIQPVTKPTMSHHFEDVLLAFTAIFPYIFPDHPRVKMMTPRLGWRPRAWFTPGWFTPGFCGWMTSAVDSSQMGETWPFWQDLPILPPPKNMVSENKAIFKWGNDRVYKKSVWISFFGIAALVFGDIQDEYIYIYAHPSETWSMFNLQPFEVQGNGFTTYIIFIFAFIAHTLVYIRFLFMFILTIDLY